MTGLVYAGAVRRSRRRARARSGDGWAPGQNVAYVSQAASGSDQARKIAQRRFGSVPVLSVTNVTHVAALAASVTTGGCHVRTSASQPSSEMRNGSW